MKHANPSTIDPKEEATSSTLTPNSADRSTYPGPTMGPSAPSRVEANALDNKFIWQKVFLYKGQRTVSRNMLLSSNEASSIYVDEDSNTDS